MPFKIDNCEFSPVFKRRILNADQLPALFTKAIEIIFDSVNAGFDRAIGTGRSNPRLYGKNFVFPSRSTGHFLKFSRVFGFVDEFFYCDLPIVDDSFVVSFADRASYDFVRFDVFNPETVATFRALYYQSFLARDQLWIRT